MNGNSLIDNLGLGCFKGLRSKPKASSKATRHYSGPVVYEADKFGIVTAKKTKKSPLDWLKFGKGKTQGKTPVQVPEMSPPVTTEVLPVRVNFRRPTTPSTAHTVRVGNNPTLRGTSSAHRFPTPSADQDPGLEWAMQESLKEQRRVDERKAMSLNSHALAAYQKKLATPEAVAIAEAQRKEDVCARLYKPRVPHAQPAPRRVTVQNTQQVTTAGQADYAKILNETIDVAAQKRALENFERENAARKARYFPGDGSSYNMPGSEPTGTNPFDESSWRGGRSSGPVNPLTEHQLAEAFGPSHPTIAPQGHLIDVS